MSRLLGQQFRSAEHDEDESDGIHVGDENGNDRLGQYPFGLGQHDGHQKQAEADIEPGGEAGNEQAADRTLERIEPLLDFVMEDPFLGAGSGTSDC